MGAEAGVKLLARGAELRPEEGSSGCLQCTQLKGHTSVTAVPPPSASYACHTAVRLLPLKMQARPATRQSCELRTLTTHSCTVHTGYGV